MSSNQPTLFGAYPWAVGSAISPVLFGSGYVPQTIAINLPDFLDEIDSNPVIATKELSDFLTVKEWLSVRLTKATLWTNPVVNANIHDTLWGKYTFGSQLFGGVKPSSSWSKGTRGPSVWTNSDGAKYNY